MGADNSVMSRINFQRLKDLERRLRVFSFESVRCIYLALTDTSHFIVDITPDQLTQAIENKYDLLKDKLLMDALMNEVSTSYIVHTELRLIESPG